MYKHGCSGPHLLLAEQVAKVAREALRRLLHALRLAVRASAHRVRRGAYLTSRTQASPGEPHHHLPHLRVALFLKQRERRRQLLERALHVRERTAQQPKCSLRFPRRPWRKPAFSSTDRLWICAACRQRPSYAWLQKLGYRALNIHHSCVYCTCVVHYPHRALRC